jgi:hypothetical protein
MTPCRGFERKSRSRAGAEPDDHAIPDQLRGFYCRFGIEHLGDWLRYGGDGAALRRLAAKDLSNRG